MDSVFAVARLGLLDDFSRLSVASQNLSNIDTPGYKRQVPLTSAFDARLEQLLLSGDVSPSDAAFTDVQAGVLKTTGRPLDLALDGDGYFTVDTGAGVRYTRRGDFNVDANGRLVTSTGEAVLGGGGEIVLPSGSVTVDRDGKIYDSDQKQLAQIDVVHFADPKRLQYAGNGEFEAAGQSPSGDLSATRVHSGSIEASNVQPAHEMISLMEVQRQVQLARNVLTARDQMLDSAANTLAQF